ncbi:MAG: S-layer homology domain-containing protein, partial [Oscillospiraceae bacterium]|nr:S-layer homology domain-containing protein [Oscillospiraceae bacterium]
EPIPTAGPMPAPTPGQTAEPMPTAGPTPGPTPEPAPEPTQSPKPDSEASPPAANELEYTGEAQELITAGKTDTGEWRYSLDKNGEYSAKIPTGTDAGEYTVWYKLSYRDNTEAQSLTVTIAKAKVYAEKLPTAGSLGRGKTLSGSKISGGKTVNKNGDEVIGGYSWKEPDKTMNTAGTFEEAVIFTPDNKNYESVEFDVKVGVTTSSGSSGGGGGGGRAPAATPTPKPVKEPNIPSGGNNGGEEDKLPFIDVEKDDWFYDDVKYVYKHGLMNGVETIIFAPNMNITRAMFVTVIYRMEGKPEIGYKPAFEDIAEGKYYFDAVAWAAENKIVLGYSDAEFAPDDPITREQMAAIIYRYANYKGYDTSSETALNYADAADISEYARAAVAWESEIGLLNGYGNNIFAPQDNSTRAQVAAVFRRFDEKFNR